MVYARKGVGYSTGKKRHHIVIRCATACATVIYHAGIGKGNRNLVLNSTLRGGMTHPGLNAHQTECGTSCGTAQGLS